MVDKIEEVKKSAIEIIREVRTPSYRRREEIKKLIDEIGLWNINQTFLAEKFGVSPVMIFKDLKVITKEIPIEELEEVSFNLHKSYRKSIKDLQGMLATAKNTTERLKIINSLANMNQRYTEFLEAYGFKERVLTEKTQINVNQAQVSTNKEYKIIYESAEPTIIHSTAIPDGVPEKQQEVQSNLGGKKVRKDSECSDSNNSGN